MIKAIDVSNYQPLDLTPLIAEHKPDIVVVRLNMPWEKPSRDITIAQAQSAVDNGCGVRCYVWAYNSVNPSSLVIEAMELAKIIGADIITKNDPSAKLWLDCEGYYNSRQDSPTQEWLRQVDSEARWWKVNLGIYTNSHWWAWNIDSEEFKHLPLWLANYNEQPDLEFNTFGGWTELAGHQYTSNPIDLSVFMESDRESGSMFDKEKLEEALHDMWPVYVKLAAAAELFPSLDEQAKVLFKAIVKAKDAAQIE